MQLCLAVTLTILTLKLKDYDSELRPLLEGCDMNPDLESLSDHQILFAIGYISISMALPLVSLVTLIPMYILSGRGTPTDTTPRRLMPALCHVSISVENTLRVAALIFGVFHVLTAYEFCGCAMDEQEMMMVSDLNDACSIQNTNFGILIMSLVFHGFDAAISLGTFIYLVCCRVVTFGVHSDSCWSTFFQCCMACSSALTCCCFGGSKAIGGDFSDISILLANFFNDGDILDITPSDVAAGLVMVRRADKVEVIKRRSELNMSRRQLRLSSISNIDSNRSLQSDRASIMSIPSNKSLLADRPSIVSSGEKRISSLTTDGRRSMDGLRQRSWGIREVLMEDQNLDRHAIAEAAWFYKYAAAAYGWVGVMLLKPVSGTLQILYYVFRHCTCFPSKESKKYVSDICFQLRRLAIRTVLDHVYEQDIVYATFKHSVKKTPYFIAMDHQWKSVVLSIRGTMSLESLLVDISVTPESLEEVGKECGFDGVGHHCHKGMLICAKWIYEDLKQHGLLNELLGPSGSHKDYTLRIVGHSLGAGVSAILSLMLRSQYPSLRCLAFGAPGCVFDAALSKECSKWTTSFIVDCDFVARLSKESVEALRNDVLNMIARIKVPKHKVFELQRLKKAKHNEQTLSKSNDDILYDDAEMGSTEFQKQLKEFYAFQETLKEKDASKYIRLYIPGRLLHLQGAGKEAMKENSTRENSFRGKFLNGGTTSFDESFDGRHTARWAKRKDFDRIVLSSHLLWDHTPNVGINTFQEVALRFGLEEPFYVERIESEQHREFEEQTEFEEETEFDEEEDSKEVG